MKRRLLRCLCLGAMLFMVAVCGTGCVFEQVENLYAPPILPDEYSQLQATIQEVMDQQGAEYAVINSGTNTSTVQLLDLNGDGVQEMAAVFFRVTKVEDKPLRLCLFRKGADNNYRLTHVVSGDGTSINSVAYEDLTGDGNLNLIISWQMSAKVHILSAYSLTDSGVNELMSTTYNESYIISDLDGNGDKEIVVFHQDSTGEGNNLAEYYDYSNGVMTMNSSAPLSRQIWDVSAVEQGKLAGGIPGIYATSYTNDGILTDVLTLVDGKLVNVTWDAESAMSMVTTRMDVEVGVMDINRDGVLEIPIPMYLSNLDPEQEPEQVVIYWYQVGVEGDLAVSCTTYHSQTDGWYLMLPDNWAEHITVARDDSLSSRGERSVVFYYCPDGGEPQPFLTIYRLTGSNRFVRAKLTGRTTLYSDSTSIYAASVAEGVWDGQISMEEIQARFFLITTEWSSE